ncbi:MAG: V-type ATPase 116kDa subunit family protein [Promethearchaeota archaeon]
MLTPEKMTLLKISIHTSQVPALLNFIPEHKMHVQSFKEVEETEHRHLHRERMLEDESEEMEQKLNEIEEFLIYYFQKMEINPEKVPVPAAADRVILKVSSVKDAVDNLYDLVDHEIRRMKGYINDKEKYLKEIAEFKILKDVFTWLSQYRPNNIVFDWFEQLVFRLGYIYSDDLDELIVSLEHEQIPMIFEFKELNSETAAFFMIYHKIQEEHVSDICRNAFEIKDYKKYYDENGFNLTYLTEQIEFCNQRINNAQEYIDSKDTDMIKFRGYIEILKNCRKYNQLEKQFRESFRGEIVRLEAFIPVKEQESILGELDEKFHTHIRIHSHPLLKNAKENIEVIQDLGTEEEDYEFGQNEDEIVPKKEIPSIISTPKIFKPFRILTNLYGVTNYNEIDPTPAVALTYPILFGLMFGDVGHGLILVALGLILIILKLKDKENTIYDAGFLLIWLGGGAIIGGILYGEIFGIGEVFHPLFASPLHEITLVLKGAIVVGVIHLSLGFFMKFLNYINNKKVFLAFVDPFWKLIILWGGAYVILVHSFRMDEWFSPDAPIPYPILLPILPAIPLLFGKSIGKLIGISYLQHESVGGLIGEQTVEVGETYLSMLSNVASYTRLLALAMAHMGLMLVVTELVNLVNSTIGVILVLVIGNLFVIVMESVLAGIHALRLTFYEFFSKFYAADGIPYEYTKIDSEYSVIEFIQI